MTQNPVLSYVTRINMILETVPENRQRTPEVLNSIEDIVEDALDAAAEDDLRVILDEHTLCLRNDMIVAIGLFLNCDDIPVILDVSDFEDEEKTREYLAA